MFSCISQFALRSLRTSWHYQKPIHLRCLLGKSESGYNIVFVFFFFLGYALKCNDCQNAVGWEDCAKNKTVTCQFPVDHCVTFYLKAIISDTSTTMEMFSKDCTVPSSCNKTNFCNRAREQLSVQKLIKCEIRCCQGDLCNRYQESQNGALVQSTKIIPGKNWTK